MSIGEFKLFKNKPEFLVYESYLETFNCLTQFCCCEVYKLETWYLHNISLIRTSLLNTGTPYSQLKVLKQV